VDNLRPVPHKHHLATVIGDLHLLIVEAAGRHTHITWQWDLDQLPKAMLKCQWNDEHVQVLDVQLDVETEWNQGPSVCALTSAGGHGCAMAAQLLVPDRHHRLCIHWLRVRWSWYPGGGKQPLPTLSHSSFATFLEQTQCQ
jgi:hypothetical protein